MGRALRERASLARLSLANMDQHEKAFQKQPKVALITTSKVNKNKARPGKAATRFHKSVGLGFKTPKEAIEGTYVDKKCPFTGDVSIRGRILLHSCSPHHSAPSL